MFFESSKPVTGLEFFNRTKELAELVDTVELLKKGSTKYLALIGQVFFDQTFLWEGCTYIFRIWSGERRGVLRCLSKL
jgi:hypothetical protein